ncbi:mechanosensitive ion channel family protein [Patescibacteria group bacterium]
MPILQKIFLNNSLNSYAWSLGVFIAVLIAIKIIKNVFLKYLHKISKKTKTDFDDLIVQIIKNINKLTYIVIGLYFSVQPLKISSYLAKALYYALIVILVYETVKAVQELIDYGVSKLMAKKQVDEKQEDAHAIKIFGTILKVLIWIGAIILVLQNLGFNVSSLIAGLGIGGIAVALAIQNILGDLFSAFSMYVDKPFEVGDFIIVGDQMGVVKKIGIKTTRIIALQGEEIIIANQDLTSSRVQNFKKMQKRRIQFAFGVLYETEPEKLKRIPDMVKTIIDKVDLAEFDRAHFKNFGDSSLDFEAVYYVLNGDYNKYMDIQQEINLGIFNAFSKEGIGFAYPTRTLYMNS